MPVPIQRPGKIVCVGLNYRDHAAERGEQAPEQPMLFAKWPTALIGPGDAIRIPSISGKVDWEGELGVLIGRGGRGIPADEALEHVGGYLCLNDVTARDLQRADGQYSRGKSLDTFCPVSAPVPAASVPDPQALRIRCLVNGQVMQDASTGDMIFSVAQLISFVSQAITLEPGDLLATGTPPGIGEARVPQVFLQPGDEVTVEIDGVGTLTNPVQSEPVQSEPGRAESE
jgi:2-keto-4-pentenoate hydratase/2-oxohepta-3-ene-1,7-dioic acid hydratase in catechol pathway